MDESAHDAEFTATEMHTDLRAMTVVQAAALVKKFVARLAVRAFYFML